MRNSENVGEQLPHDKVPPRGIRRPVDSPQLGRVWTDSKYSASITLLLLLIRMMLKRLFFFFFDRQAILMEKRKNRWTLDHTLKMQSVYSLTHTCPLKAVFLSRMSSRAGSVPHPKNNKGSVTGPLLCLGMP